MKKQEHLYFITGNANKFKEMQSFIPEIEQLNVDLPEIQELDPKKIIHAKLIEAKKRYKGSFIVEDTSLNIKSLNDFPGPLVKWLLQSLGNKGLAELAFKYENTKAEAKTIIGYLNENRKVSFFSGNLHGKIVQPRGKHAFGWDPIFLPDGHSKTLAQMSQAEKNSISMRKKAVKKLIKHLKSATNN